VTDDNRPERTSPASDRRQFWAPFRRFTSARIGLARSGAALATSPLLDFRMAHARARDAVQARLDEKLLFSRLEQCGLPVLAISSAAKDRKSFLMRPDLGRTLDASAHAMLAPHAQAVCDVVFVVADGLSSQAVQSHAPELLAATLPALRAENWRIAPLVAVQQGRVAIGDAIANALHASIAVILIGERPGLSSPDSMGVYLTWQPGPNSTDAQRNCISNIRPEGIGYADAAFKLLYMLREMRARRLSGVLLKDESDRSRIAQQHADRDGRTG